MTTFTVNIGNLRAARAAIRSHVPGGTAKKRLASRTIALTPEAITHTGPLDVPEAIHVTVPLHGTGDTTEPIYVDATDFNKAISVVAGRSTKKNNEADMHIELIDNTVRFTAPDINHRSMSIDVSEHHHTNTLDADKVNDDPLIVTQAGELAYVWRTTHKSLGTDNTLPMLTMYHVGMVDQKITFAATDRFRMSLTQPNVLDCTLADEKVITLPANLVKATAHIDAYAAVRIYADPNLTTFVLDSDDGTRVIARTTDNQSVNPNSLYKIATGQSHDSATDHPVSTTPDTDEVTAFIKELASAHPSGNVILYPNTTSIDAEVRGTYDIGTVYGEDALGVDWVDDVDGSVGSPVLLHNDYLVDTLSMISTDKVEVTIRGGMAPVLIHEVGGKTRHAVMPIRM